MESGEKIPILKASGEQVFFDPEKLRHSLFQAGADPAVVDQIEQTIISEIKPNTKTRRIYQRAFSLLRKYARPVAAKYKLKRAIMELGPSGYPFERYVGAILKQMGYDVQVGVSVPGRCITHEVDVLGNKGKRRIAVECKFGNTPTKKVDVKVALYIQSRFKDLEERWIQDASSAPLSCSGWIVTNGEFTSDAIAYGGCAGLHLISWSYPSQGNLKNLIDRSKLYPITSLTTLTKAEKKFFLDKEVVLSHEVPLHEDWLAQLQVPKPRQKRLLKEIESLCRPEAPEDH